VLMFVAPGTAGGFWPWPLTPLTSQVLAAWVLALGVAGAHALYENDVRRVRAILLTYPVLVALHAVALVRFGDEIGWGRPGAVVYLVFLGTCLVLGAYGLVSARRPAPEPAPAAA
jgi:hypothetical protein